MPAWLAESTAATTSTSMREVSSAVPFASETPSERRAMLTASRHARLSTTPVVASASVSCSAAVTVAPMAQAAMSVVTVGSETSTTAPAVTVSGKTAMPMSARLTRRTLPRACAMDISKFV